MSFLSLASGKSLWRGYSYYKENRVLARTKKGDFEYAGIVNGTGKSYQVHIDLQHPRKSTCNCPHADGRKIICKHMVALYFSIFPKEAETYIAEVEAYEKEQEEYAEEMDQKIRTCINRMSKTDLRQAIYALLCEAPEWLVDRFIEEHLY